MSARKNKLINLFKITKVGQEDSSVKSPAVSISNDSAFFITKELFLKNLKGLGDKDKAKIPSISV